MPIQHFNELKNKIKELASTSQGYNDILVLSQANYQLLCNGSGSMMEQAEQHAAINAGFTEAIEKIAVEHEQAVNLLFTTCIGWIAHLSEEIGALTAEIQQIFSDRFRESCREEIRAKYEELALYYTETLDILGLRTEVEGITDANNAILIEKAQQLQGFYLHAELQKDADKTACKIDFLKLRDSALTLAERIELFNGLATRLIAFGCTHGAELSDNDLRDLRNQWIIYYNSGEEFNILTKTEYVYKQINQAAAQIRCPDVNDKLITANFQLDAVNEHVATGGDKINAIQILFSSIAALDPSESSSTDIRVKTLLAKMYYRLSALSQDVGNIAGANMATRRYAEIQKDLPMTGRYERMYLNAIIKQSDEQPAPALISAEPMMASVMETGAVRLFGSPRSVRSGSPVDDNLGRVESPAHDYGDQFLNPVSP